MTALAAAFGADRDEIRRHDFSLDSEQLAVQEMFSELLGRHCPPERVREAEPGGFDPELWSIVLAQDALAMALPQSLGGVGSSNVDCALVAEQVGRSAAPVPLIDALAGLRAIAPHHAQLQPEELESLASGGEVLTIAPIPLDARPVQLLPSGSIATRVIACEDERVLLYEGGPWPHVENLGEIPAAWWSAEDADGAVVLASGPEHRRAFLEAVASWSVMVAAAVTGLGQSAIDVAVDFAKTRMVSGVPIGALQGISHPLAKAHELISSSRRLAWKAAWFLDHEPQARPELPPMALWHADRAADFAAATALHAHGGSGFMLESDVTIYLTRAKGWGLVADPKRAAARVADLIGHGLDDARTGIAGGLS